MKPGSSGYLIDTSILSALAPDKPGQLTPDRQGTARAGLGGAARVLVPCPAEWRWLERDERPVWFPGFSVYRQQPSGSWDDAFERLRDDLFAQFGRSARTDS